MSRENPIEIAESDEEGPLKPVSTSSSANSDSSSSVSSSSVSSTSSSSSSSKSFSSTAVRGRTVVTLRRETPLEAHAKTRLKAPPSASIAVSSNPHQRQPASQSAATSASNSNKTSNSTFSSTTTASSCHATMQSTTNKRKDFVGGAQAARTAAQKKKSRRILTPLERQHLDQAMLPTRGMSAMERFCAALLRSSAADFARAADINDDTLWATICRRVGLTPPTTRLPTRISRATHYFAPRAALVLEEARHALSEALAKRHASPQKSSHNNPLAMTLHIHQTEINHGTGHTRVTLRKLEGPTFTRDQLYHLRAGTVFACQVGNASSSKTNNHIHLAAILSANRDQVATKRQFTVMFFRPITVSGSTTLTLEPLESLVSQQRAFEAVTNYGSIAFLSQLLGNKGATHTRFDDDKSKDAADMSTSEIADFFKRYDAEQEAKAHNKKPAASKSNNSSSSQPASTTKISSIFTLRPLNPTQERAARTWMQSKPNTLTLVQGPPGCGKTSLLHTVIARYVAEFGDTKRLLVCAPTNKAVVVLAARFLASLDESRATFLPIMVGDADKLLGDELAAGNGVSTLDASTTATAQLPGILCYTWLPTIIEQYQKMLPHFRSTVSNVSKVYHQARCLEKRLLNGLYGMSEKDLFDLAGRVSHSLNRLEATSSPVMVSDVRSRIVQVVEKLQTLLKTTPQDAIWRLLLANANVIFCTCASAGGMLMKTTPAVDDLVIDEAAAATEPELCIPFHLKPKRMLCVGDPRQLPATVLSRRALQLGLDQSLHERLMDHCGFEHIMLDVQYRMRPEISAFPSQQFYNSKIQNGPNVQALDYRQPPFVLDGRPYIFVETTGPEEKTSGGSSRNPTEANAIVRLVEQIRDRALACDREIPWYSANRLRIITFYQGQVSLIKRRLRQRGFGDKVVVATVDSSQGCEADVVLVSFVRSPRNKGSHARQAAGFLTDDRRINVAITRARYQLVCVGNVRGLSEVSGANTIQALTRNALRRKVVRPLREHDNKEEHFA